MWQETDYAVRTSWWSDTEGLLLRLLGIYEDVSTQSDNYHDQQLVTDEHVPCRIAPSEVRRCECSRHDNCHFGLIDPRNGDGNQVIAAGSFREEQPGSPHPHVVKCRSAARGQEQRLGKL